MDRTSPTRSRASTAHTKPDVPIDSAAAGGAVATIHRERRPRATSRGRAPLVKDRPTPLPPPRSPPVRPLNCLLALFALSGVGRAAAADPVEHRIMFAEYGKGPNRLVELDAKG